MQVASDSWLRLQDPTADIATDDPCAVDCGADRRAQSFAKHRSVHVTDTVPDPLADYAHSDERVRLRHRSPVCGRPHAAAFALADDRWAICNAVARANYCPPVRVADGATYVRMRLQGQ
jgi:hypothetical protein